ncbi:MAG: dienelactone hydrolase family protein [Gammaproteobacteria bacterium]|nr:dienelactone hydrolase family protein [Gammaproteobacteria bacterium]
MTPIPQILIFLLIALLPFHQSIAAHEPWVKTTYPQDEEKTWWSDDWWEDGKLESPSNYDVVMEKIEYENGDTTVPAYLFRPKTPGKYLPVLFQHGRRGLDNLTLLMPKRLAARGFIVLAPDVFNARFIEKLPMEHDYDTETDVARGVEQLLKRNDILGDKACIVSHTRGGYIALKALVTHKKQVKEIACYVSSYPHWQDPNLPEPYQVYRYATEINDLKVPVLVFLGEHDQYQRIRPIMEGINTLKEKNRNPTLIVYPGVGRGFDFRPPHVRTFADDLATKDAIQRTEKFIRENLGQTSNNSQ